MRPSESAGPGSATVTISLDSWPEGKVASTTHSISITEPKAAAKADPISGRLRRSLVHPDRKSGVTQLQFSADGSRLFSAGYPSGVLQFWDVASGKELRRIESPRGYRGSAEYALMPDDWSTVYVPKDKRKAVRFEKDGKRDSRVEFEGEILAFDVASGQPRPSLKPSPAHGCETAYLSPDGRCLVALERPSYSNDERPKDTAVLWDTRAATAKLLGPGFPMVAFSADSKQFVLTLSEHDPESGAVKMFSADGTELTELAKVKDESFYWPKISPDGTLLVVEQTKRRPKQRAVLRVWNLKTRKEVASFQASEDNLFIGISFSSDSKWLAATDDKSGVHVWDITTGKPVREKSFGTDMRLGYLTFSSDGRWLAVNGQPKNEQERDPEADPRDLPQPRVFLFDLADAAREPEVVVCPHGYSGALTFSPDGNTLAVGGAAAVHLFDVREKRSWRK